MRCRTVATVFAGLASMAAAGAANALTFTDHFSPPSSQWSNSSGNWTASGGDYYPQNPGKAPPTYSGLGYVWTNNDMVMTLKWTNEGVSGLYVDTNGTNQDGVLLMLGGGAGASIYWNVIAGGSFSSPQDSVSGVLTPGNSYTVTVKVNGDVYKAYLDPDGVFDGSSVLETTLVDNTYASGHVALYGGPPNEPVDGTLPTSSFSDFSVSGALAAPEPATWALTVLGVGLVGGVLRTGRRQAAANALA